MRRRRCHGASHEAATRVDAREVFCQNRSSIAIEFLLRRYQRKLVSSVVSSETRKKQAISRAAPRVMERTWTSLRHDPDAFEQFLGAQKPRETRTNSAPDWHCFYTLAGRSFRSKLLQAHEP
jgi:hypothetical protein